MFTAHVELNQHKYISSSFFISSYRDNLSHPKSFSFVL